MTTAPISIGPECFDARAQRYAERLLFWTAAPNDPRDVLPGDWVKICRNMEWFWIRVASIDEETIVGAVDNHPVPVRNSDLPNGTRVAFELRNVYDVLRRH